MAHTLFARSWERPYGRRMRHRLDFSRVWVSDEALSALASSAFTLVPRQKRPLLFHESRSYRFWRCIRLLFASLYACWCPGTTKFLCPSACRCFRKSSRFRHRELHLCRYSCWIFQKVCSCDWLSCGALWCCLWKHLNDWLRSQNLCLLGPAQVLLSSFDHLSAVHDLVSHDAAVSICVK